MQAVGYFINKSKKIKSLIVNTRNENAFTGFDGYKGLKEIAKEVKENGGSNSYDTWGNTERSKKYKDLKFHLIDQNKNAFKVDDEIFVIVFRHSNGITAMNGTPDSISVKKLRLL